MNLVPQFGFLELILIAVIALVVVGPRDLPRLMRSAGRMAGKAKAMAAEFTAAFDQMARETEMEELRQELDALKRDNIVAKTRRDLEDAVKPIETDIREESAALNQAASNAATPSAPKPDPDPNPQPAHKSQEEPAKS
jgi:sec-independent protein translocase protein TatB